MIKLYYKKTTIRPIAFQKATALGPSSPLSKISVIIPIYWLGKRKSTVRKTTVNSIKTNSTGTFIRPAYNKMEPSQKYLGSNQPIFSVLLKF